MKLKNVASNDVAWVVTSKFGFGSAVALVTQWAVEADGGGGGGGEYKLACHLHYKHIKRNM